MSEAKNEVQPHSGDLERVVMLLPYVAEEHKQLLKDAEKALDEYSALLLSKIKKELFEHGWDLNPHTEQIRKAEKAFLDDPVRQQLVGNLGEIKMLVERPRFIVAAT
jgi:hypothetical protein